MKVLYITDVFSNKIGGGESKIAWEYVNALARQGVVVWVIAPYVDYDKKAIGKNIRVFRAPFGFREPNFSVSNMFKCFLFSIPLVYFGRIDLIHVGPNNRFFPYSKFKVRPLVLESFSDLDYSNDKLKDDLMYDRMRKEEELGYIVKRGVIERIWRKSSHLFFKFFNIYKPWPNRVDSYFCHSYDLIDYLSDLGMKDKAFYHPNGIDKDFFKEGNFSCSEGGPLKFLFVGHISKRKGVEYLIKAFNKLSERYDNMELNLVGGGAPSTVAFMKDLVNVKKNNVVNFIGSIPPDNINRLYKDTDVFVLPSLSETFGMVNIEAMACGKPVISTRVGGIVDYLEDGKFGFLVDPADENDLFEKMSIFASDCSKVKEMGEGARDYVVGKFDWDVLAKKAINKYRSII